MRIPFDLIAAVICIEGIRRQLLMDAYHHIAFVSASLSETLVVWGAFLLTSWLANELVARDMEWRTRFGHRPSGVSSKHHPMEIHIWGSRAAMLLNVVLYAGILWFYQWPLQAAQWPEWLGFSPDAHLGRMPLKESSLVMMFIMLAPFLISMVLSWVPRWRFSGARWRRGSFMAFLIYEAKLTWVLLILWLIIALHDATMMMPVGYSSWLDLPAIAALMPIAGIFFVSVIAMPRAIIWWWDCRPLPDGELKDRLLSIMEKSGVKVRAIMTWGPGNSGLLNACVLGPWARFRYVLISPQLVETLGVQETEAVLAHELGHARHGHLTLLLVMILCLSAFLTPIMEVLTHFHVSPIVEGAAAIAFVILYIWLIFGAIMRLCEREADLASAEIMGTPAPIVNALEKLALLSGNIREVWCWHHGSIAERVAAVERLSQDSASGRQFHSHLRRVRVVLTLIAATALVMQVVSALIL